MSGDKTPKRVLLVEDDRDMVELLCLLLREMAGWEVTSFTDAQKVQRDPSVLNGMDVALVDLRMEPLDGPGLVRSWREDGPLPCPVVFLTGHHPSATELALVDGAIQKPFTYQELVEEILAILERSGAR